MSESTVDWANHHDCPDEPEDYDGYIAHLIDPEKWHRQMDAFDAQIARGETPHIVP